MLINKILHLAKSWQKCGVAKLNAVTWRLETYISVGYRHSAELLANMDSLTSHAECDADENQPMAVRFLACRLCIKQATCEPDILQPYFWSRPLVSKSMSAAVDDEEDVWHANLGFKPGKCVVHEPYATFGKVQQMFMHVHTKMAQAVERCLQAG